MIEDLQQFMNNNFIEDPYLERMIDPTTSARIKGPCGDDMEFYLVIKDNIIVDVKYYTEGGCCSTRTAGHAVAKRAKGKNIYDALEINPGTIIKEEKELPPSGKHCAILATTTFYRAIATYLLEEISNL